MRRGGISWQNRRKQWKFKYRHEMKEGSFTRDWVVFTWTEGNKRYWVGSTRYHLLFATCPRKTTFFAWKGGVKPQRRFHVIWDLCHQISRSEIDDAGGVRWGAKVGSGVQVEERDWAMILWVEGGQVVTSANVSGSGNRVYVRG